MSGAKLIDKTSYRHKKNTANYNTYCYGIIKHIHECLKIHEINKIQ